MFASPIAIIFVSQIYPHPLTLPLTQTTHLALKKKKKVLKPGSPTPHTLPLPLQRKKKVNTMSFQKLHVLSDDNNKLDRKDNSLQLRVLIRRPLHTQPSQ